MENDEVTILTLQDFRNAFNTVDFNVLLCSLNISPSAIDWFRNYLFSRWQRISIESTVSSWYSSTAGYYRAASSLHYFSLFL